MQVRVEEVGAAGAASENKPSRVVETRDDGVNVEHPPFRQASKDGENVGVEVDVDENHSICSGSVESLAESTNAVETVRHVLRLHGETGEAELVS